MPDIAKYGAFIQEVESGTYATLGLRVGSQTVTPGAKVPKAGTYRNNLNKKRGNLTTTN
jgi:hypothetical protein